jgi:hypothetical protein
LVDSPDNFCANNLEAREKLLIGVLIAVLAKVINDFSIHSLLEDTDEKLP